MKYILVNWVLLAAFPGAIFMSIVKCLVKKIISNYILPINFLINLLIYIILCTVISVLFGLRKWNKCNKLFETEE
ncbi:hypothetical protein CLHUN_42230 [Ruminiclostridium hungatei]|uniref:Uncharacterized protein n=1 Tax=Ruminiclostridium hungatei TaxID=48256 RepID=A0A1V4SDB1_RUMHU|nr:hypothetical protein CLHUN_42230 [Ruminiclostridium hungatei]